MSITSPKKHWSEKQKVEAIQSYLLLGNLAMTSRILGIPEVTLRVWKASPWWKEKQHELKTQEKMELSSRLKKIVDASLTVVEDRLVNGNFQLDQKTGQVTRIPVALKDAHKVAVDMQERQEILEKVDRELVSDESIDEQLNKLASKFADMATKRIEQKHNESRTINVEDATLIEDDDTGVQFNIGKTTVSKTVRCTFESYWARQLRYQMKFHKLAPFNYFYTLTNEEELKAWAKKKKISFEVPDNAFGYAVGSGSYSFIVVNPTKNKTEWDAIGTIIHESVHIFQACMKWVGESDIGHEMEAYSIEKISTDLLKDYHALLRNKEPLQTLRKE